MYKFILEDIANIIFSCWHKLSSTEIWKHLLLKQPWENKWQIIYYIPNPQHQRLPCITAKLFNNICFFFRVVNIFLVHISKLVLYFRSFFLLTK